MSLVILGGLWKGRRIKTPPDQVTRPTASIVRKSFFDSLQHEMTDARVLDICAGSGAVGLEALSRGAGRADFVESHPQALRILESNIELLGCASCCHIYRGKAPQILKKLEGPYDIIYCDPPYAELRLYREILQALPPLAAGGRVVLEGPLKLDLTGLPFEVIQERRFGERSLYHLR